MAATVPRVITGKDDSQALTKYEAHNLPGIRAEGHPNADLGHTLVNASTP